MGGANWGVSVMFNVEPIEIRAHCTCKMELI